MSFQTEDDLFRVALASAYLRDLLDSRFNLAHFVEPRGLFGIPDLVVANSAPPHEEDDQKLDVFAFEMKLSDWKRALIQAFRYKAFANYSAVLLDEDHIAPALAQLERFETAGIGLLGIGDSGDVDVFYFPTCAAPYSGQLEATVREMVFRTTAGRGMTVNSPVTM